MTSPTRSFPARLEARIERRDRDTVRLVLDDVYPDGRRVLFTHVELPLSDLLEGKFSRDLAAMIGENLLIRLAALPSPE